MWPRPEAVIGKAGQEMEVQMKHGLPCIRAAGTHQVETGCPESVFAMSSHFLSHLENAASNSGRAIPQVGIVISACDQ